MAKGDQIERNNLIIQYTTHIETLKLEDGDVDAALGAAFRKSAGTLLTILLNGNIIYAKGR